MSEATQAHELLMPRLSDTMTEGVVRAWLKDHGETVMLGDAVAEVETDKATVELEAPADGVVLALLVPAGGVAEPGAVIAVIGPEGMEYTAPPPGGADSDSADDGGGQPRDHRGIGPAVSSNQSAPPIVYSGRRKISPLARRVASQLGVDLDLIPSGSGPGGRILRQDVERVGIQKAKARAAGVVRELSPSHRTMARRMTQAKREIPHYYVDTVVDVTGLLELRSVAGSQADLALPINICLVRAVALALRALPRVNASWSEEGIIEHASINIGVAVALPDDGLLVPVIRDADRWSLPELAADFDALVARAKAGRSTPEDLSGGTFTLSNLGAFGVDTFHAVVNPPESGILAVGAVRRSPVYEGDQLVPRDLMQISLSADHRVFSGATAAAFIKEVRGRLEQPFGLLLSR